MTQEINLIDEIKHLILSTRGAAIRAVDQARTIMYWEIGKRILEEEQAGKERADYKSYLLKTLSKALEPEFGSSFSVRQLARYRQFYRMFPIVSALRTQLTWTHYKLLLAIENQSKREYYIHEASHNNWSSRQLERQINSQLYERLLLSNDKESVLAVARREKIPVNPTEIIKDPIMLELGNGFSFVTRQKRIHIDGDEFFIDLVFYNRLLQCFVLLEIKTGKLTHQDIGQLQMYVNYYDRVEKLNYENRTIGILLCTDKNDTMVRFTLPEDNKSILASKYAMYLPSEQQLIEEIKGELNKIEEK